MQCEHKIMFVTLLVALLVGWPANARLAIKTAGVIPAGERTLAAAAASACARSVPAGRPLALLDATDSADTTLVLLHALQRWPVLLAPTARAHAIVLVTRVGRLPRLRDTLRAQSTWSARALFVVVLSDVGSDAQRAQQALEVMWAVGAAHVVVLSRRGETIEAHAWRPYEAGGQCAERVRRAVLVDTWVEKTGDSASGGRFKHSGDHLFASHPPRDLHGCPVTVATFEWPPFIVNMTASVLGNSTVGQYDGLEIRLLETIAWATNFRPIYLPPPPEKWGWEFPNGSWVGAYSYLHSRRAQVMIASLIKSTQKMEIFDNTHFYVTNAVVWVVPRARAIPHWQSLAKIFTASFWGLLVTTILITAAIFWAMAGLPRAFRVRGANPQSYNTVASCLSNALAVLLGVSVFRQPRSAALRAFFLIYAMYCLQINTAYQSSLITSLTNPRGQKQIATDQDLHDSKLKLFFSFGYDPYLNKEDILQAAILARSTVCSNDTACLNRAAYEGDAALLADRAFVEFLTPGLYTDRQGQPLLKAFPSNLISYHVGMMLNKDSLLLDRFDQVIDRIREAGLMSKWRTEVARLSKTKYASPVAETSNDPSDGARPLTTAHLQGAYAILAAGLSTSTAVFLGEVVTAWCARRASSVQRRVGR